MSKFIDGPWEVCTEPPNDQWFKGRTVFDSAGQRRIADTPLLQDDETAFANAQLIAAAPDMYEALKLRSSSHDFYCKFEMGCGECDCGMVEGRAALAKAEGKQ